jgi:hypothetical protein
MLKIMGISIPGTKVQNEFELEMMMNSLPGKPRDIYGNIQTP